jgi:hypothetical protein
MICIISFLFQFREKSVFYRRIFIYILTENNAWLLGILAFFFLSFKNFKKGNLNK